MKNFFSKITKTHYLTFISFFIGYIFALTNSDEQLTEIFKHFSPLYFTIANIIYFLLFMFIIKTLLKKYKYFEINENNNFKKIYSIIKLILIGYFLGSFTILGNALINVLFI